MTVRSESWIGRAWAMAPGRCDECGGPMSVACWRGSRKPGEHWGRVCLRRRRKCAACSSDLEPGDRVWRPHNPGSTVASAGWPSDAHQTACVCQACARRVMARGVEAEDGGRVFGPLRLVVDAEPPEPGPPCPEDSSCWGCDGDACRQTPQRPGPR